MLIHVPLTQIDDNPFQRRADYGDVATLAGDIHDRGLLQKPIGRLIFAGGDPITGYDLTLALSNINAGGHPDAFPAGLRVQLAFGHRRLRALRLLDEINAGIDTWATMPVYIDELTDDAMLDAVWSENQHRSDINPIEQAQLLAEKLERARAAGGNQQTVASDWGLDRSTIANKLRLLDLPDHVQQAIRGRTLSERQALALLPIVELDAKLNGADDTDTAKWDKGQKPEPYGKPITPAAYLAHAVANPDRATSDAIRDYARRAADHAGNPLPDYLAKYEAAPAESIVQSTCAGCPHRHNQHCLRPSCHNAKWEQFQAAIPALAAAHTGLPWSDDPAAFPKDRGDAKHLHRLYGSGHRDTLVIGWAADGWQKSWFTDRSDQYRGRDVIRADWHKGLILGRLPQPEEDESEEPPTDAWRHIVGEANTQRRVRVQQAFTDALDRLLDDRADHLRPLLYLLSRRSYGYTYQPDQPIAEALHVLAGDLAAYTPSPYKSWADLFTAIGLDPAAADPTDPADLLREQAADALIDWARNRQNATGVNAPNVISPIAVALGQAINAFEAAGITPADDDAELADLARWLPIAYAAASAALNGNK